jgi:hypothetical protein
MEGLTSLSGLDALTSVGGEIDFRGDNNLPADLFQAFVHRLRQ